MSHSLVITLLSDLGTRDASVAGAKAILMKYAPGAAIIDISHHITQYDLQQAAYLLLCAYSHFPRGAVHVLPVDVFAGDAAGMLLAEKDGYFFIAPDNGLLPLAFGATLEQSRLCLSFSRPYIFSEWMNSAGRVIEALQKDSSNLPYTPCEIKTMPRSLKANATPYGVDCNILYIDRYENVVLDITKAQFDELVKNRPFKIKIMRMNDITTISNNYNDVPVGEALCRFNEAGFLEIALNHAPAASLFGLSYGNTANLRYQVVKIFF